MLKLPRLWRCVPGFFGLCDIQDTDDWSLAICSGIGGRMDDLHCTRPGQMPASTRMTLQFCPHLQISQNVTYRRARLRLLRSPPGYPDKYCMCGPRFQALTWRMQHRALQKHCCSPRREAYGDATRRTFVVSSCQETELARYIYIHTAALHFLTSKCQKLKHWWS